MFAKIIIGLFLALPLECMEKPQGKSELPTRAIQKNSAAYSDQDRESIISMIATLKQGHLLYPIADSVFKASIKHALLDGKDLLAQDCAHSVDEAVTAALTNLARTIKQTCPKKDFLESVDMILEQIDDRYNEEAKPVLAASDGFNKEVNVQLAYSVDHYEQFNQKELKHMVHLHKRAAEMLQEKLNALSKDAVQKWYAEFMKDVQGS
jgi:hypothetical protein